MANYLWRLGHRLIHIYQQVASHDSLSSLAFLQHPMAYPSWFGREACGPGMERRKHRALWISFMHLWAYRTLEFTGRVLEASTRKKKNTSGHHG